MNARTLVCAGLIAISMLLRVGPAGAQDVIPQIVLNEALVEKFIAALPEMNTVTIVAPQSSGASDAKLQAAVEAIAKKHGFESFQQFSDVSNSIALVIVGIDPATKTFTEPKVTIEQQIAALSKTLADLKESLAAAQRTTNRGNIELVTKFHEQISFAATARK